MHSERGGLSSTIHSVSEMSQNIYTAAQLALKSRSCAGTWQTAPGHWEKSRTSSKGWLGPLASGSCGGSSSSEQMSRSHGQCQQPPLLIWAEQPGWKALSLHSAGTASRRTAARNTASSAGRTEKDAEKKQKEREVPIWAEISRSLGCESGSGAPW